MSIRPRAILTWSATTPSKKFEECDKVAEKKQYDVRDLDDRLKRNKSEEYLVRTIFFLSGMLVLLLFYIYLVRMRNDAADVAAAAGVEEETVLPDDIAGLILFSRCWRFVRVGHGIAATVNDMVRAKQLQLQQSISELKAALRQLESENYAHEQQLLHEIKHPTAGPHKGRHEGLHKAHDALAKLAQQAAY